MRKEEASMRYLSPLVKQDLAKLDLDGESRRLALKSLQQIIEQLNATSIPKFLAQIAESRQSGRSRSYAISLYEEVARVHRRLIRPHLLRVMSSLIQALAASGSSPQLQQACGKVTTAMARYTIDPTISIEDAKEIIWEICNPLAEALAGQLEPVATGAAACIHALIGTKNWKYACNATIQELCQRTTVALSKKPTCTVFHLQLASALASMNPDTLVIYGATLLKVGEEVLKNVIDSWQHRKAAAKLLQGVLTILDKETLKIEVVFAIHALENCRLDKMPHVRAAVSEALYTAKMLASGDSSQSCGVLSSPLCKSICRSIEQSQSSWSKRDIEQRPSPWTKEDVLSSLVLQKQIISPNSQESNQMSFSPVVSISTTESMDIRYISTPAHISSQKSKRTLLYPSRGMGLERSPRYYSSRTFSPSDSSIDGLEFNALQKLDHAEENMTGWITSMNGHLTNETIGVSIPYVNADNPLTPSQLENLSIDICTPEAEDQQLPKKFVDQSDPHVGKESLTMSNSVISRHMMSPMVSAIVGEFTETASNILAKDDVGVVLLDSQIEEVYNLKPNFRNFLQSRLENFHGPNAPSGSSHSAIASNLNQSFLNCTMESKKQSSGGDIGNAEKCMDYVEVETNDINMATRDIIQNFAHGFERRDEKSHRESGPNKQGNTLKLHYNTLAHHDLSLEEKAKPLITTKNFMPFGTPKQLMRSLQSLNYSNLDSRRVSLDQDISYCHDGGIPSNVDMDVETASEAGWSVRHNPIASDESLQGDNFDEEKFKDKLKLPFEGLQQLQNVRSVEYCVSPRDIHVLSPFSQKPRLIIDGKETGLVHQENTSSTTFNSATSVTTQTCIQANNCQNCDESCFTCNPNIHKYMFNKVRACGLFFEDLNVDSIKHISNELQDVHHHDQDRAKENGLHCNCLAVSEGFIVVEFPDIEIYKLISCDRESQSWWNSRGLGQYLQMQTLVAKKLRNLYWYGEIVLGGTLCVILTLPLAMAFSKVLNSPPDHLIPT